MKRPRLKYAPHYYVGGALGLTPNERYLSLIFHSAKQGPSHRLWTMCCGRLNRRGILDRAPDYRPPFRDRAVEWMFLRVDEYQSIRSQFAGWRSKRRTGNVTS